MTVERWRWRDDPAIVGRALEEGRIVAVPTESSYALAADPENLEAVTVIFRLKRRARSEPLPVLISDPLQIARWGASTEAPGLAEVSARWPAPLTVVVGIGSPIAASAGRRSLAVRVPAHVRLRRLIATLDAPITATSANRSGEPPACDPRDVAELLVHTDAVVIDEGTLDGGPPSTLVRWNADTAGFDVLREGAYPPHLLRNTGR